MNKRDKRLNGRNVSVWTSRSACRYVVMSVVTLRTQIKLFSFLYWDCLHKPKYLQGRPSVGAHLHTPPSVGVCARVHVFRCISRCVSGCSDSRNLTEALKLQHFKAGCSEILQYSYSSWIFFLSPTVTDKWWNQSSFPSTLRTLRALNLFSWCILAFFQKRTRRARQHVHASAQADILALKSYTFICSSDYWYVIQSCIGLDLNFKGELAHRGQWGWGWRGGAGWVEGVSSCR